MGRQRRPVGRLTSSVGLAACRRGTSHRHRGLTDLPAQVSQAIGHTASLSVAHGPRTPSAEQVADSERLTNVAIAQALTPISPGSGSISRRLLLEGAGPSAPRIEWLADAYERVSPWRGRVRHLGGAAAGPSSTMWAAATRARSSSSLSWLGAERELHQLVAGFGVIPAIMGGLRAGMASARTPSTLAAAGAAGPAGPRRLL